MMPSQQDPHEPPDPLIEDLRALFAAEDPVPPLVVETAKASLGWRRLDAELAELLSDSALEEGREPALARGAAAALRAVSFAAGDLVIDVEIVGEGSERRLLGQLSAPVAARIELQSSDSSVDPVVVQADALGRFRAPIPAGATVRLRIGVPDAVAEGGIAFTETSWVPL